MSINLTPLPVHLQQPPSLLYQPLIVHQTFLFLPTRHQLSNKCTKFLTRNPPAAHQPRQYSSSNITSRSTRDNNTCRFQNKGLPPLLVLFCEFKTRRFVAALYTLACTPNIMGKRSSTLSFLVSARNHNPASWSCSTNFPLTATNLNFVVLDLASRALHIAVWNARGQSLFGPGSGVLVPIAL
jgi:hypothetical protein